jgi:DNA polymerase-3 subunit delta'
VYNVVVMKDFIGNIAAIKTLKEAVRSGNLSHAYLFCGPGNVGKTKAGEYFAKILLCSSEDPFLCTSCASCKLFDKGNHPDFFHLDSDTVLVEDVRLLINSLDLKPYMGEGKVAMISHAENLTKQALNSLLKTLEEPSAKTTIILTTENPTNLLPTIVSRTRRINFALSSERDIYELLNVDLEVIKGEATVIAKLSAGRPGVARSLSADKNTTSEIINLAKDFSRIYKSTDVFEKIAFADKLSKDKEGLAVKLGYLELATRADLMGEKFTETGRLRVRDLIVTIDNIARSREMISANVNPKLVIEGLLLGSIA